MPKYNIYIQDTLVAEKVIAILMPTTVETLANRFSDEELTITVKRVKEEPPVVEKVEEADVIPMPTGE